MTTNSPPNLAVATSTCGINGCVSTPSLSSTTSYLYTQTSTSSVTTTTSSFTTSISSSTTTTTATSTTTSFSYTSTISTTLTTTSYSTVYTATQTNQGTAYSTLQTTTTRSSVYTNLVTQKGASITSCPVSYVTNGNRLEPYAQFLRNFRDREIENTTAGHTFLSAFNAWYYSWAPAVTYSAATNPFAYRTVQVIVVPLLGVLYASYYSYQLVAPFSPEAAALTAGVVAASLIGLAYVAPIGYLASRLLRRHIRFNLSTRTIMPTAVWFTASILTLLAAYATSSGTALALGTVNIVLSALAAGGLIGTRALAQIQLPFTNPALLPLLLRRYTKLLS